MSNKINKPTRPKPELIRQCDDPGTGPRCIQIDNSITLKDVALWVFIIVASIVSAFIKCR